MPHLAGPAMPRFHVFPFTILIATSSKFILVSSPYVCLYNIL